MKTVSTYAIDKVSLTLRMILSAVKLGRVMFHDWNIVIGI